MRRNNFKNHSNNNNNKNHNVVRKVVKDKIKPSGEFIGKQSLAELRVTEFSKELQEIKQTSSTILEPTNNSKLIAPLITYTSHLEQKLKEVKPEPMDKQILPPMDVESNPLFFPFQISTSDRMVVHNLKKILCFQLTNDYYIQQLQKSMKKPLRTEYDTNFKLIQKSYNLNYELHINKFFSSFNNKLIPYLQNESGQLRTYELLQTLGVAQLFHQNDIPIYTKTDPGSGDAYIYENGSYVLLDLKSADLSEDKIKELLLKTIPKYKKFDKSYLCFNGDEDQIKTIIEKEGIEIPSNIIIKYQNTSKSFENNGFYNTDNLTKINAEILYHKLSQPKFQQEIEKLLKKHTLNGELDLIAFDKDLNQFVDIDPFIECQNQGDNFFDPKTISDFKDFTSNFNDDNDSGKS